MGCGVVSFGQHTILLVNTPMCRQNTPEKKSTRSSSASSSHKASPSSSSGQPQGIPRRCPFLLGRMGDVAFACSSGALLHYIYNIYSERGMRHPCFFWEEVPHQDLAKRTADLHTRTSVAKKPESEKRWVQLAGASSPGWKMVLPSTISSACT